MSDNIFRPCPSKSLIGNTLRIRLTFVSKGIKSPRLILFKLDNGYAISSCSIYLQVVKPPAPTLATQTEAVKIQAFPTIQVTHSNIACKLLVVMNEGNSTFHSRMEFLLADSIALLGISLLTFNYAWLDVSFDVLLVIIVESRKDKALLQQVFVSDDELVPPGSELIKTRRRAFVRWCICHARSSFGYRYSTPIQHRPQITRGTGQRQYPTTRFACCRRFSAIYTMVRFAYIPESESIRYVARADCPSMVGYVIVRFMTYPYRQIVIQRVLHTFRKMQECVRHATLLSVTVFQ